MAPINEIDIIKPEKISCQEIIDGELKNIGFKKNIFRGLAYLIMVLSICAFFSPITTLLGYVPLVGGFLSGALGIAIFIAAVIVAIPLFLLAVAISWMAFHPKIGIAILVGALAVTAVVLVIIFTNKGGDQPAETVTHLFQTMRNLKYWFAFIYILPYVPYDINFLSENKCITFSFHCSQRQFAFSYVKKIGDNLLSFFLFQRPWKNTFQRFRKMNTKSLCF